MKGLTQEAFAELAGVGYKYYQNLERGSYINPTLKTLEALADVCGISVSQLLDESDMAAFRPRPYKVDIKKDPKAAEEKKKS